MRILFVAARLPGPLLRGFEVRAYHQLRLLGARHRVTLVAYGDAEASDPASESLRRFVAEVVAVPLSPLGMAAGLARGLGRGRPIQASIYDTPRMRAALGRILAERRHDVVHVQMSRLATLLDGVAGPPRVVDLIDALSVNMARRQVHDRGVRRWLSRFEAPRLARWERHLCASWDRAIVASERDRAAIGEFPRLVVSSNAVDATRFPHRAGERDPGGIVFTGNLGYFPNVDAVCWFAREVLPAVRAAVPAATLTIAGARPARAVRALARLGSHVRVAGPVPDIAVPLGRARVAVAPIRAGSGQSLKVLEAFASGTPLVATARASDGLAVEHGVHLRVADTAEDFAREVVALLRDPGAAERLAARARSLVVERYTWESKVRELEALYEEVVAAR